MTNTQRPKASLFSVLLVTALFSTLAFTTGIAVWRFTPAQKMDIFVVEPISESSVQTPQQTLESTPSIETELPVANELVVNNHPASPVNQETASEIIDESPTVPEDKPSIIEQSTMGWTIIIGAITAPFTK